MAIHLERDLERLKQQLLAVGAMVENATAKAIASLIERRPSLAEEVMHGDHEVDQREVELEEECLKVLALHQPVATDLRFIVSVLKANNDLERIGDLAVNIAERVMYIATHEPLTVHLDFETMGTLVRTMLKDCLDSVIRRDLDLAHKVRAMDDEVDRINRKMFETLQEVMLGDCTTAPRAIHLLSASRHLERIGDHATNVAEDVIFMVEGKVVRHQEELFR
ncbi:MAG: phosphate signaling complex protein PhoU [Planctomycetota bacterium]|nr:phosphate signaling complex protein PhoU [Planctomycetota bacterium]